MPFSLEQVQDGLRHRGETVSDETLDAVLDAARLVSHLNTLANQAEKSFEARIAPKVPGPEGRHSIGTYAERLQAEDYWLAQRRAEEAISRVDEAREILRALLAAVKDGQR